jgi:hypothetical protein
MKRIIILRMFNKNPIRIIKSQYGTYKIVDTIYNGRPARMLYGAKNSPQSGIAYDDSPELLFDYNQRFLEIALSQSPARVLVIGGGAFMLPSALFKRFPNTRIDVVEIDETLVKAAYAYFDLPRSKRLRVFVDDGARFVRESSEQYELIIIDAFSGYTIPHHLIERDTIIHYERLLKKGGTLAMNFISEYKPRRPRLAHEILASFGEVFPALSLYPSDPDYDKGEEQNLVLTASHQPLHFEYLQSSEYTLYQDSDA